MNPPDAGAGRRRTPCGRPAGLSQLPAAGAGAGAARRLRVLIAASFALLAAGCAGRVAPAPVLTCTELDREWDRVPLVPPNVQTLARAYEALARRTPDDAGLQWRTARAASWLALYAPDPKDRPRFARMGEAAARRALELQPAGQREAPVLFWSALALGLAARTPGLRHITTPETMRELMEELQAVDPDYEYGGAERFLGVLYAEVPELLSFGDLERARAYLERALARAPAAPENHWELAKVLMYLAEQEAPVERGLLLATAREHLAFVLAAPIPPHHRYEYEWRRRDARAVQARLEALAAGP